MIVLTSIPKGHKNVDHVALSPEDVAALQNMADDMHIGDAAETSLQTRRQLEHMISKLKTELNIKTNYGLIAYLMRKQIIK